MQFSLRNYPRKKSFFIRARVLPSYSMQSLPCAGEQKFSPNIVDTPCLWQPVLTMVEAAEGIALVPACVQHLRSNGYHSELCVTKDVRWMWCWRGVRVIPTRSAKAS